MNILTTQQQEILFKPFGRELIKRMSEAAMKRNSESPDENFVMDDSAMQEAYDVLEHMFARDDTPLKAVIKKQTNDEKPVKTSKKKVVSVAVTDTSDEDEQVVEETPVKTKKRGRPKKPEESVSAEDLVASMMGEPQEKKPSKKISKAETKLLKRKSTLINDINNINKQLEEDDLQQETGINMDVADLKDMLKKVKTQLKEKEKAVKKLAAENAKAEKKASKEKAKAEKKVKVKGNFTSNKRLQNNDGEDMKGLNGAYIRYKINKDTLEKVKVSPKNYTEEANKCFDELEVTAPKKKAPKKKVMKCFRAYHKQNTTSKSIVWKPYHEDKAKREKTEAKYLKTMIAVDQWKFAEKAGDTADKTIQNPYVKEQTQENAEELSEDEYTVEKVEVVEKSVEKKVEVVEKPVEKKAEVVKKPVEKKVEVVEKPVEETVEEDSAEEDEFTIDGAEEFAHFDYPNKELLKAPNNQVWDKEEQKMIGYYDENTGEIVDELPSDDEEDDSDDENAYTEW
jgi:hypothetical protein